MITEQSDENEPEAVEDKALEDEDKRDAEDAYVAKGKCGKKIKWTLDQNGTLRITGKGAMKNYSYNSKTGTITAPWGKYTERVRTVIISKGVTTVGSYAFYSCNYLASISLPTGLKAINANAFGCTSIGKISIPKGVKTIGTGAFALCQNLVSIDLPAGLTKIGDDAFGHCYNLKSIVIPQGVTSIEPYTFVECYKLESVTIPSSVKKIGFHAFFCTGLTKVNIPIAGLTSIDRGAFCGCTDLTKIEIPLSVTYLGDDAFGGCKSLKEVCMSNTLVSLMSDTAFSGCDPIKLTRYEYAATGDDFDQDGFGYLVTFPAIDGTGTVMLCTVPADKESVTVPNTVEYKNVKYKVARISSNAFKNHTSLKSVVIGSNVTTIDTSAFQGCKELVSVIGGSGLKIIGAKAFVNCPKLKVFNITSPVLAKISSYAFWGDKSLNTLYLKNTTKLTKSGVKKSLKGSSVKTVKVKKSKVKKYKKIFKKKNCGKKVKVKK